MLLIALLLVMGVRGCPATVADQLELLAQPLECFRGLYDHRAYDNDRLMKVVRERLTAYQRLLQELKMSDEQHLQTAPVVKWAQSNAQIFISFKLSHRQDSPTCSDIRKESFRTLRIPNPEGEVPHIPQPETLQSPPEVPPQLQDNPGGAVTEGAATEGAATEGAATEGAAGEGRAVNGSVFVFESECFFTTQKFWFSLKLQFPELLRKLVLRKQGLGLYALIGDKQVPGIWAEPFLNHRSAAIWPQMRHKHEADMDRFFELSARSDETSRRRRRKRPRKQSEPQL